VPHLVRRVITVIDRTGGDEIKLLMSIPANSSVQVEIEETVTKTAIEAG
jgi:hypothetical protein